MVCVEEHSYNKKQRYYRREHAGHKSKLGQAVRPYSTCGTLFLLFVQQTCQHIARMSSISLVHSLHGWAIPQHNRMVHQIWSDKTTEKLLQSYK